MFQRGINAALRYYCIVISVFTLFSASCAGRDRQPENALDKLVTYSEITADGEVIRLSLSGGEIFPSRLPDNDEVDINSTIRIEVPRANGTTTEPLANDEQDLSYTLEKLYENILARISAAQAFSKITKVKTDELPGSAELKHFQREVAVDSSATREFLESPGLVQYARDEKYSAYFKDTSYRQLGELLKEEIAAKNARLLEAEQSAREAAGWLSFEAFVQPSKSSAYMAPVHLPGYDNILNGKLERIDNPANIYDVNTIERIDVMIKGAAGFSELSDKINRGERSLGEAIITAGNICFQRYSELKAKLQPLPDDPLIADCDEAAANWKDAGQGNLSARLDEIRKLYNEFDVAVSSTRASAPPELHEFLVSARALMSFASINTV
jgi:hypothetical protein